jgi:hypothetical protein
MTIVQHNRFLIKLSVYTVKACFFILLYAVIIFGIFSLQFNNFVPGASPARPLRADNHPAQNAAVLNFDSLAGLSLASESTFRVMENTLADLLIAAFESQPVPREQIVIAYLAAMGERNSLDAALSRVSASFTANTANLSYVSAPYFDNLAAMYGTLATEDDVFLRELRDAVRTQNLAFFNREGLAESLLRCDARDGVDALLRLPAAVTNFDPTVTEAAAILELVSVLTASNSSYAPLLEPVTEKCLSKIPESGTLQDGRFLLLNDSDHRGGWSSLSLESAVRVGTALMHYGEVKQQAIYLDTGRLIINSLCSGNESSFNLETLSYIYLALNSRGRFTPHTKLLAELPEGPVWAWTVAEAVTYSTDSLGRISIGINYPSGQIHHLIIHGVSPFRAIEIQGLFWRPDTYFESYNASGYNYNAGSRTLFLRTLQRSPAETVRLTY